MKIILSKEGSSMSEILKSEKKKIKVGGKGGVQLKKIDRKRETRLNLYIPVKRLELWVAFTVSHKKKSLGCVLLERTGRKVLSLLSL